MVSVVTNVMRCKCASFHHNFIYLGWILLLILLGSRSTVPPPAAIPEPTSPSSVELREDNTIKFKGFNDDQIPPNTVVDVNIGTNYSPFDTQDDRYRILVDPLFGVCDSNAKLMNNVTAFCFAVSNYTGFATFNEYNERNGESSSLSEVAVGTSHEKFPILSKRTVLVLEAVVLFTAIHRANTHIHRLKLDMQGHELTTLKNIKSLLRVSNLVVHVKSECFCPNKNGLQIYQIDNSCENMSVVLQDAGYATKWECSASEWSDVIAYKKGVGTDFLSVEDFN
jgi:FkbM family methyltransferase